MDMSEVTRPDEQIFVFTFFEAISIGSIYSDAHCESTMYLSVHTSREKEGDKFGRCLGIR